MAESVLGQLDQAGEDQGRYGRKLAGFSASLAEGGDSREMAEPVQRILDDARQFLEIAGRWKTISASPFAKSTICANTCGGFDARR